MSTTITAIKEGKDLLTCRTCLATERKLYSIYEQNLFDAYKTLIGNEVSPFDGLPQYICNFCGTLLLKFITFRRNSEQAQNYLEHAKITKSNLTTNYLISLKRSTTKVIDITQNEISELKTDYDELNELILQEFDYTETIEEDSKIFTDFIKHIEEPKTTKLSNNTHSKSNINKLLKEDNSKPTQNIKRSNSTQKKGRYFEIDEKLRDFEKVYNVDVIILSAEEQMKDVISRKLSSNYLHSPYKCELCYKGVMDEDSLKKHVLYQHDPSRGSIICEYCSFRYKDKRGLNQHLKSHRLKFACKQCSYVSRTTFNAKEHYKMHTGHTHKCRHCGKAYEKLSSHLTHLRMQHPSDFIWCNICGEAFIGEFGLNAHKKRAHRHLNLPFHCVSCDVYFASEPALTRHSSVGTCSSSACVHCGDPFDKAMELRQHLLGKHRSCKVYQCEKCHKTFSRQSLHSAHYKRAHVDAKDKNKVLKPWVCEICGKILPNKCVLLYHQRNHTGERPYHCTLCSKSFTMRKLLQSHLRVHTSDRPYACTLCPKTFKGLSALRSHEQTHSGGPQKSSNNRKKQI
ncbi:unnamed protein product [Arctia plantaginis]|uniref:Uncharacterized protein n=1 Tax=Arctia plantaginis TaxID=874455 RepID=A0A8S1B045_ARCPL|nr:unnamed protein product [Arctia plantaginis]